jgi:hypothetical protein
MPDQSEEFRQRLLGMQQMSPALKDAYQNDLDALLHPPLTARTRWIGIVLLVELLVAAILIVRADLFYHVRGLWLVGHAALAIGFIWASVLIMRDLQKRHTSPRSVSAIASLLTATAGITTVVAMLIGIRHASDPKSMFDVFYVFVFYFACAIWALESRISTAQLSATEQSLRIECRLADIAERLQK